MYCFDAKQINMNKLLYSKQNLSHYLNPDLNLNTSLFQIFNTNRIKWLSVFRNATISSMIVVDLFTNNRPTGINTFWWLKQQQRQQCSPYAWRHASNHHKSWSMILILMGHHGIHSRPHTQKNSPVTVGARPHPCFCLSIFPAPAEVEEAGLGADSTPSVQNCWLTRGDAQSTSVSK